MPTDPPPDWVLTYRQAVGARIREARRRANLTQEALGALVGVDHKTIHRIEYATSEPGLGLLVQIARAVGSTVSDLVRE